MRRQEFTPAMIDSLRTGKLVDQSVIGLSIVVRRDGRKVWTFRRRVAGCAKIVSLKFGTFPERSIAAARDWATNLNKKIVLGEDPREATRAARMRRVMTVETAHDLYMKVLERGDRKKLKPRTLYDKRVIYAGDIGPRLGNKSLLDLTDDQCWEAVYDKAKASKDRANKMAAELNCFLRWCSGREGRMSGIPPLTHPAPTLTSTWFSTGPKSNSRYLCDEEMKWLLQACAAENLYHRRAIILLLLTAARRNEVIAAPASEFIDGIWRLPAERSKNGDINTIALGAWGCQLAQTDDEWLFPSPRIEGPQLNGWFKVKNRIHARMEELAGRPIPNWHFHDLRRTFRSNARRVGIAPDIAELMLNHRRPGLQGIYDKNEELELRAAGFAAWERHLVSIAGDAGLVEKLHIPPEAIEAVS